MRSRGMGILLSAMGVTLMAIALFAPAAFGEATKEGYERFEGCPSLKENEEIFLCQRVFIDGGHFQMGSKDVPIKYPLTLSGGVTINGEVLYTSKGGLSHVKEPVPGGIVGLTGLDFLLELLKAEALQVFAVTELAGTPFVKEGGTEVELPIKVHLENPVLGNKCYVGSNANPITLHMIFGTTNPPKPNKPITGVDPIEGTSDLPEVLLFENGEFVDNSFAAPAASGCVLNIGIIPINIDALVNLQSGLPSAAGTNETRQHFKSLEIVSPESVYP